MSGLRGDGGSAHGVDFIPVADPLARDPELRFVTTLPVLGIATQFATNSRAVHAIVERAFGVWRALGERHIESVRDPVKICVVVAEGDEGPGRDGAHSPVQHISPGDGRLIAKSAGSVAVSDPERRESVAYVTTALVADADHFRTELLEATTLSLLSELDRHPLHAAAVVKDGRVALFAAASGTGKSTLAYLCRSAGYALMAEDRVYVQLDPAVRVWGWPNSVRLLPEVAARFDAARSVETERRGKSKIEIDIAADVVEEQLVASELVTCVLTRDGGPASLEPLEPDALARVLSEQLAAGFDRFPTRWPAVQRALVSRGGWRLNLSNDPTAALPLVHDLMRGVPA